MLSVQNVISYNKYGNSEKIRFRVKIRETTSRMESDRDPKVALQFLPSRVQCPVSPDEAFETFQYKTSNLSILSEEIWRVSE